MTARRKYSGKPRKRNGSRRKPYGKKKRNTARLVLCAFVEIIVILTLVVIVGWNKGVGDWMREMNRPLVKELDVRGINSEHALLMQVQGGKVLGEMGADEKMYPASLTKMMTAIVALDELKDLNTEITLTREMFEGLYEQDASQAGFQPDERVRAIDLLYGVMLPSGAECCIALADHLAGSEETFVELMNEKAKKIGMDNTHFCDSTGLHNPEHYSTVRDMAILLKYCLKNDTFREIIASPWHSTGVTNIHPDGITYYNTMLKNLPDRSVTGGEIIGGKTGYTDDAGLCLASFAEISGREYILVTSGAAGHAGEQSHIQDARTIYNRLGEAALALESE